MTHKIGYPVNILLFFMYQIILLNKKDFIFFIQKYVVRVLAARSRMVDTYSQYHSGEIPLLGIECFLKWL